MPKGSNKKQIIKENIEILLETRVLLRKHKIKIVQHTVYFYQLKKKNKGFVNIYPTTRRVLWARTLYEYLNPLKIQLQLRTNWNIMDIAKKIICIEEKE